MRAAAPGFFDWHYVTTRITNVAPGGRLPALEVTVDAPLTLGTAGRSLWDSIAGPGKYALRPDECSTLEDACLLTDMIDTLDKAWNDLGRPFESMGSTKQPQAHYLISEIRTHRMARQALLRQLKLPDVGAAASTSTSARKAASARWSHGA